MKFLRNINKYCELFFISNFLWSDNDIALEQLNDNYEIKLGNECKFFF